MEGQVIIFGNQIMQKDHDFELNQSPKSFKHF